MSSDHLLKVVHPFNRPNLFYEVRYQPYQPSPEDSYSNILNYIQTLTTRRGGKPCCGIVYARQRKTCDELADFLRRNGVQARPYHRGIQPKRLDDTLREWEEGEGRCDVVVATVCFGMGIDKGDVRYVLHYDLPNSFEYANPTLQFTASTDVNILSEATIRKLVCMTDPFTPASC